MARVTTRVGAGVRGGEAGPRTARQRQHYHWLAEVLRELEFHLHGRIARSGQIPEEWHEIALERGEQPKERVTLYVEADVVKFFRASGRGHLRRMSDVLRAFMHARLAGVLSGAEGVSYAPLGGSERLHRLAVLREYLELETGAAPPPGLPEAEPEEEA